VPVTCPFLASQRGVNGQSRAMRSVHWPGTPPVKDNPAKSLKAAGRASVPGVRIPPAPQKSQVRRSLALVLVYYGLDSRPCARSVPDPAPYGLILGEGRGEGVRPAGRVAWAAQAVVDDPAGPVACVGPDVVAQQEMREQEITAIGQDLDGFAILRRCCQEAGMSAGGQ
jgi:hypothetical protein